jgi:hypothetical protein
LRKIAGLAREDETAKQKRLLAEQVLDMATMKEPCQKNGDVKP